MLSLVQQNKAKLYLTQFTFSLFLFVVIVTNFLFLHREVYVGLYGFSFMEAGMNVMTLFRERGWTSIITDSLVDTALFMISACVGAIVALFMSVYAAAIQASNILLLAFVGFIIGYSLCATLLSIVSSAVNTVIVCYAEAPNEFQSNHPQLATTMKDAWRKAYPDEFRY
jgi:Plasma-membrane choline transporter